MDFIELEASTKTRQRVEDAMPTSYSRQHEFITERKYNKQFFSMYQYRLNELKRRVDETALQKWGNGTIKKQGQTIIHKNKILDITSRELCWVSGTIFCDLQGKSNILKDVEVGEDDKLPQETNSYVNKEQDVIMLEDESGRAILHNPDFLQRHILVTGCIVAILGVEIQAGIFEIVDIVYPKAAPQIPYDISNVSCSNGSKYLAFVSGLKIDCENTGGYQLKLEMLQQFLSGELGGENEQDLASQISRLIIAGDSIMPAKPVIDDTNYGSKNVSLISLENVQKFDQFLNEILPSIPVTILPGNLDPVEMTLPQPPIHHSLFPKTQKYLTNDTNTLVSNPVWLQHDQLRILGTSGQNLHDIGKYFDSIPHPLQLLESCMKWQNIAPTAPDTLFCYPFENFDPFTLSEMPHVFFAGNQSSYGFKKMDLDGQKVTLLSIPSFAETGQVILLDCNSLDCKVVKLQ